MISARGLAAALAALTLLAGCATTTFVPQHAGNDITTIVLVRHAEKATNDGNDPALNVTGQQRAERLAWMLADIKPDALFATEYRRTQQTLMPLSMRSRVSITQVAAANIEGLAQRIRTEHQGETVVIAAHSNTVPAIIRALGSETVPEIPETDYTNLYLVSLPAIGAGTTVRLHFAVD